MTFSLQILSIVYLNFRLFHCLSLLLSMTALHLSSCLVFFLGIHLSFQLNFRLTYLLDIFILNWKYTTFVWSSIAPSGFPRIENRYIIITCFLITIYQTVTNYYFYFSQEKRRIVQHFTNVANLCIRTIIVLLCTTQRDIFLYLHSCSTKQHITLYFLAPTVYVCVFWMKRELGSHSNEMPPTKALFLIAGW